MTLKMCKHANYACEHDKQGTCTWAPPGIEAECKHDALSQIVAERNSDAVGAATALDTQIGGDHYKSMKIQPMEFSMMNGLDACQHTAIKYIARFRAKGGIQDLEKAKHVIDMLIEFESRAAE